MKFILMLNLLLLAACGKMAEVPSDSAKPECTPRAVANTGGDVYFSPDPSQSKVAQIGTPALPGMTYKWEPAEGLSSPFVAQPIVKAPAKTTLYTLTVTSNCGMAQDYMRAVMLKESPRPPPTVKAHDKHGVLQEYFTGYIPSEKQYHRAQFRDFQVNAGHTAVDPIPDEFDLKQYVQRIFRQQCGDCWAQGAVTAFETLVAWVDQASRFFSRQQVIDCSGYGSCGGGQISVGTFESPKGAVMEADDPYLGRNKKCKTAPFHENTKGTFFVRDLTWPNLQRALMEKGPLEVCGSASALGDGGWVSRNPRGATNHCYALVGWYDGAKHGKAPGSYGIIANSWGTGWGDDGYGYYLLAKDGVRLDGDVITEAAGMDYKPACTPQPKADAGPDRTIKQIPGTPQVVQLGTPGLPDHDYEWDHPELLDNPHVAMPIAHPLQSTVFTVKAKTKCGESIAKAKVTVFRDVRGGSSQRIEWVH